MWVYFSPFPSLSRDDHPPDQTHWSSWGEGECHGSGVLCASCNSPDRSLFWPATGTNYAVIHENIVTWVSISWSFFSEDQTYQPKILDIPPLVPTIITVEGAGWGWGWTTGEWPSSFLNGTSHRRRIPKRRRRRRRRRRHSLTWAFLKAEGPEASAGNQRDSLLQFFNFVFFAHSFLCYTIGWFIEPHNHSFTRSLSRLRFGENGKIWSC